MSVVRSARVSKMLIFSYVVDWILIFLIVVVGAIFAFITPNKRPFSLTNPGISFPHVEETVSVPLLGVVALVVPAAIIFIICILLVPGPTVPKSTPKQLIFQRKLWEWHTGWLGLALSQAAAFLITSGMKNLFGKPRPDLLDRCQPDIPNLSEYSYSVWGAGNSFANFNVVSAGICTQTDSSKLNDGFRSFPSGHASFASGGLVYLSLFLASKLAITIPFLAAGSDATRLSAFPSRTEKRAVGGIGSRDGVLSGDDAPEIPSGHDEKIIAARNQAAGPPIYLLVIVVIPFFASVYITASRYSDFRHDGFDLSFGFMLGAITSLFAFRYYHLPINQGAGWSWGPRSRDRAFWAGVGVGNYAGDREPRSEVVRQTATGLEAGAGVQRISVTNEVRIGETSYGHAK